MLRWIIGVTRKDKKRSEDIRHEVRVACINDKVREARSRGYGHVARSEENNSIIRNMKAEVYGQRSRRSDG